MNLFKSHDYRWWFVGDTAGASAIAIRQFAVPLAAYALSGSPALAGLLGTVQVAVATAASLPGGVLIDRHDRRRIIRGYALAGASIWAAVGLLALSGRLTFWLFFALATIGAAFAGLFGYATEAALRTIVDQSDYPKAMATNEARDAGVQLAAGPLGGALYAVSLAAPFLTALLGYATLAASTWGIKTDLTPPAYDRTSIVREIAHAWRWLWSKRRLQVMLPIFAAVNVGEAGVMFTLQLALLERGVSPLQIGTLSAVLSGSFLLGALLVGRLVQRVPTGGLAIAALVWITLCQLPTALTDSYPIWLGAMGLGGLLLPALNAAMGGYLFAQTPVELQGRVQTLLGLFVGGLSALSPLAAGLLLPAVGLTPTIGAFLAILALATVAAALSDAVRSIPRPDRWEEAPL